MNIEEVEKFNGPFVGYFDGEKIKVLDSLSPCRKSYVVAHEFYHSTETKERHWFIRELRAALGPLWGFVLILWDRVCNLPEFIRYLRQKGRTT